AFHGADFLVPAAPDQFKWCADQLALRFSIKHRPADLCLGLKIEAIPGGGYAFGQQHYLQACLGVFGIGDCKPASTPLTKGEVDALTAGKTRGKALDSAGHHLYRQILGKLMYAIVGSRPKLAHALLVLGRFAAQPDTFHLQWPNTSYSMSKLLLTSGCTMGQGGVPP